MSHRHSHKRCPYIFSTSFVDYILYIQNTKNPSALVYVYIQGRRIYNLPRCHPIWEKFSFLHFYFYCSKICCTTKLILNASSHDIYSLLNSALVVFYFILTQFFIFLIIYILHIIYKKVNIYVRILLHLPSK